MGNVRRAFASLSTNERLEMLSECLSNVRLAITFHMQMSFLRMRFAIVNIVRLSRPRLTNYLLKKHVRHQCDVCTPSSDCLMMYNQFVTLTKYMAATVSKFLRSRQENINN